MPHTGPADNNGRLLLHGTDERSRRFDIFRLARCAYPYVLPFILACNDGGLATPGPTASSPPLPPPLTCDGMRRLARSLSPHVVGSWDGRTPFRVNVVQNFPEHVEGSYLQDQLEVIAELAAQIEEQLGYPLLEPGEITEVPDNAPAAWDQDWESYWRRRLLVSDDGEILALYLNDDNQGWGGEGSPMSAHYCCGSVSYNRRYFDPPHWDSWTGPNSPSGKAIIHEVFHLLGFAHYRGSNPNGGVPMSPFGLYEPWLEGSPVYYATEDDIEAFRCIFPEQS